MTALANFFFTIFVGSAFVLYLGACFVIDLWRTDSVIISIIVVLFLLDVFWILKVYR